MATTYYTKCGKVSFIKSGTSSATRFEDISEQCGQCPFIERTTTTRKGKDIKITFCQAGSKKPNNNTDYYTVNDDDATTLSIISLDWELLKEIYEYASGLDGCTARNELFIKSFHAIDRDDCRKSLPIYFESNKRGKAAKRAVIEKYFEKQVATNRCMHCNSFIEDNATSLLGKCEARRSLVSRHRNANDCDKFERKIENDGIQDEGNLNNETEHKEIVSNKKYVDEKGRLIFVHAGLGGDSFMTMYQDAGKWNTGGVHRLKSKELPCRPTEQEAQIDLDSYASIKKWKTVKEKESIDKKTEGKTCNDCALLGDECTTIIASPAYVCKHIYPTGRTGHTLKTNPACEYFEQGNSEKIPHAPKKTELDTRNVTKRGIKFRDYFYDAEFLKDYWKSTVFIRVVDGSPDRIEVYNMKYEFLGFILKLSHKYEYLNHNITENVNKADIKQKVFKSCASCGHIFDELCDIQNSKLLHANDNHGCIYWQDKDSISDIRCNSCSDFEYTTSAHTWGRCKKQFKDARKKIYKEIHKNWFCCGQYSNVCPEEPKLDTNNIQNSIDHCLKTIRENLNLLKDSKSSTR